jgi:hypothetical protein
MPFAELGGASPEDLPYSLGLTRRSLDRQLEEQG